MYINLLGIAIGMKYLHSQKTVQRDLKPLNVLLDENYYPRISDFGYAKKLNDLNSRNYMNSGVGTIIYMAPEILTGSKYNYKVDVYSYGILAYELITCQSPILEGENELSFVIKVPNGRRPGISMITDQDIAGFIQKCWSADPSERPPFSQIVDTLEDKRFYSKFDVDVDEIKNYLKLFDNENLNENSTSDQLTTPDTNTSTKLSINASTKQDSNTSTKQDSNASTTQDSNTSTTQDSNTSTTQDSYTSTRLSINTSTTQDTKTKEEKKPLFPGLKITKIPSFKAVFIGDTGTEKFKIIQLLIKDPFGQQYVPIGAAYYTKRVSVPSGDCIFKLWDTAGGFKYRALTSMYLRRSNVIILTANANVEGQYKLLQEWLDYAIENNHDELKPLFVVAASFSKEKELVEIDELSNFAKENGLNFYRLPLDDRSPTVNMFSDIATNLLNMNHNEPSIKINIHDEEKEKACLIF